MHNSYGVVRLLLYFALVIACLGLDAQAQSETSQGGKRVALVIGNAAYQQGRLSNPVNDARAIANRLRTLGFEVVFYENLKTRDIGGMYREFRSKIAPGGVALVFYAGHGLQFKGQNYFPAVDSEINGEEDVPLQSVNLGTLLDNMEEAKAAVNLVFLDACRDNPFARRFRSASRGLAKVEVASGTLIHYATKPGSVASDGDNANGTYTEALLAQMGEAGVPVELMLKRVANRVVNKTHGKQEPWMEGSLRGDFYFIFKGPVTVQMPPATDVDPENQTWSAALRANSASAYQAYLDAYPRGRFAVAAKIAFESLRQPALPNIGTTTRTNTPAIVQTAVPPVDDPETALWNAVQASNTADDYGVYLKQFPKGRYTALAQTRAKKLTTDAQIQADAQAWQQARSANNADAYTDYLSRYPGGRFVALAQTAQKRLQREAQQARQQPESTNAQERNKLAVITAAKPEQTGVPKQNDMIGILQIKDASTGVANGSMDIRVLDVTAERTTYSTGEVIGNDGAVLQLRVGGVVLHVISGALWTTPIKANASGFAKVKVGADDSSQGTVNWHAAPLGTGKAQVTADVDYMANNNLANQRVNVSGKWSAVYDGKHAIPESSEANLRGGFGSGQTINRIITNSDWAAPIAGDQPVGKAAQASAEIKGDVIGTLLIKDALTGRSTSNSVRILTSTSEKTTYSTGDIIGADGAVLQVRVGDVVLQVVSGALWTLPIKTEASGTAKVQVGVDRSAQGTIKWKVAMLGADKAQVTAGVDYMSNANLASQRVNVAGKWSAIYDGKLPVPESDETSLRGGGASSTQILNMSSAKFVYR